MTQKFHTSVLMGLVCASLTASAGSVFAQSAPPQLPPPQALPPPQGWIPADPSLQAGAQPSPQQIFDSKYVWFEDYVAVSMNTGMVVRSWSTPYEGRYRRPLRPDEFYIKVGRPDYAAQYSAKQRRRIGLMAAGGALMGAGLLAFGISTGVYLSSNLNATINCGFSGPCTTPTYNPTPLYVGAGIFTFTMLGGMSLLIVGIVTNPHPVPPHEARRLADEYNQGLRQQLGLAAGAMSMLRRTQLTPFLGPQGGLLAATTTF